jgi:hypothetical protein
VFRGALGSTLHSEPVILHLDGGIDITASVTLAATGMDWRRLERGWFQQGETRTSHDTDCARCRPEGQRAE